jgi:hypothetical protein
MGGLFFTHPVCGHSYARGLPLYLESWHDPLAGRMRREAMASAADVGCNRARGGENAGQPGDVNRGLRCFRWWVDWMLSGPLGSWLPKDWHSFCSPR